MPIYEYSCKKCGDFEITQRMTEEPLKKCPTCGAKVTKLISQSAFHLKGGGWYVTDYAKNGASKDKDKDSSDSKPSGDTKETSSNSSSSDTSTSSSTKESSASTKEKSSPAKESSAATKEKSSPTKESSTSAE